MGLALQAQQGRVLHACNMGFEQGRVESSWGSSPAISQQGKALLGKGT